MKTLLLFLLLQQQPSFIVHWDTLYKSSGELIKLTYDDTIQPGEPMRFQLYRATGIVYATPVKLVEQTSPVFNVVMPTTTTTQYRFFVVPVVVNSAGEVTSFGPESNSVLVLRK